MIVVGSMANACDVNVAATGTDVSGCGGQSSPCQSIQFAVDQAFFHDRLCLHGTLACGAIVDKPLVLMSPNHDALLDCTEQAGRGLTILNTSSGLTISGLVVRNATEGGIIGTFTSPTVGFNVSIRHTTFVHCGSPTAVSGGIGLQFMKGATAARISIISDMR